MCMDDMQCVVPFLSDNPAYVHGVELGFLFTRMNAREPEIHGAYHRKNDEQFFLMAERMGYDVPEWTALDDTWFSARFVLYDGDKYNDAVSAFE